MADYSFEFPYEGKNYYAIVTATERTDIITFEVKLSLSERNAVISPRVIQVAGTNPDGSTKWEECLDEVGPIAQDAGLIRKLGEEIESRME
jgi:hypothetical protein